MHVVVTGSCGGLGRELVREFALKENHIVFAVSRNTAGVNSLMSELGSNGKKIIPVKVDLRDKELGKKIIDAVKPVTNEIDVLINNAGVMLKKSVDKVLQSELMEIFEVNTFSAYRLVQNLIDYMGKSSKAHVVNIGSMGGFQGSKKFPGLSVYSASKAALANMTESLAEELQEKNIAINYLAFGSIETKMFAEAFPGHKASMTTEDAAKFIYEFATSGSNFFNGKIIPVSLGIP